jgi:stearoyl-CoA desaturase (delta-9 desaturase)
MRQRFLAVELLLFVLPHACLVAAVVFWDALAPRTFDILLGVVMYLLGMLGFEVALHRYFAHRAFVAKGPLRIFLAFAACAASQGPVLWWVWAHRHHHRHSDTDQDLHTPVGRGAFARRLWHSHIGWHIRQSRQAQGFSVPPDLAVDRTAVAAHRAYYPLLIGSLLAPCVVAFFVYGDVLSVVRAYVWVSGVRMVVQLHFTCALTSLAHLLGGRPFPTKDNSRNIGWLALPTLGASWHNNHHAYPRSATLWLRWWQVDLSYAFIAAMKAVGAAEKVQHPDPR